MTRMWLGNTLGDYGRAMSGLKHRAIEKEQFVGRKMTCFPQGSF